MKINTAIKKLQEMLAKDPGGDVSIKKIKPKKKKRTPKRMLTATLKKWAQEKSKNGGSFTLMEAITYYERIGGSGGVTTVLFRLRQIGARVLPGKLAESHLKARWNCGPDITSSVVRELIASDPTFEQRYDALRRAHVASGGLAPLPIDKAVFEKSWGKRGEIWVHPADTDDSRRLRIQVKPQAGYVPQNN